MKCDRNFPSCSRCSKAGLASNCRYETGDPSEARNGQLEESATEDDDENSRARFGVSNRDANSTNRQVASEPSSKWPQNRKIYQLESRLSNIEESLAVSQSHTANRNRQLPVLGHGHGLSVPSGPTILEGFKQVPNENETMIFRKHSFSMFNFSMKSNVTFKQVYCSLLSEILNVAHIFYSSFRYTG